MNHKQKLGYMALGAGIMALGIIIGQSTTPDIEAQSNGVFDEIVCNKLTVVDESGKRAILLYGDEESNGIFVFDPLVNELKGIELLSMKSGNRVFLSDRVHRAITLAASFAEEAHVLLSFQGKRGVRLSSGGLGNQVGVFDKEGVHAIELSTFPLPVLRDGIKIYNEAGKMIWIAPDWEDLR